MWLVPLTEKYIPLYLKEWHVICGLSKIDPKKSCIVRRKRDGFHFMLCVPLEKKPKEKPVDG